MWTGGLGLYCDIIVGEIKVIFIMTMAEIYNS